MTLEYHPDVFPSKQVCDLFGIRPEVLKYWLKNLFTREKHSERVKLNFRDLCMVACIVFLKNEVGLSVQKIREKHLPLIEDGINRARSIGRSLTDLKVTVWEEVVFVYEGSMHSNLAGWHKNTIVFLDLWNKVRGIKIKMQQLREDYTK